MLQIIELVLVVYGSIKLSTNVLSVVQVTLIFTFSADPYFLALSIWDNDGELIQEKLLSVWDLQMEGQGYTNIYIFF